MVTAAARQYWDAIEARENIRGQQQSLDLAQKSNERDQMALDLGALPKLDIFQSQSQVAQRKVGLIQAQYAYRDAIDRLRQLIGADLVSETRDAEIVLEDDPAGVPVLSPLVPFEEALAGAMRKRPELTSARRLTSIDELNARVAKDSMLPRLDLRGLAGGSGLGGNQVPISGPLGTGPSQFIAGGVGDALGQLFRFGAPFYGFGLQLTIPTRSSTAQASLTDALVSKARDQYQQRQIEQQVIQEVKLATNQLEMDRSDANSAQATLEAAAGILRRGDLFGFYPEGTRSPDGRLYRGRAGLGWLALNTGAPVIPVAMIGTRKMLPPGAPVPRPTRIDIKIGKPLEFSHLVGDPPAKARRIIADEVMRAIADMSGQEYVHEYASDVKAKMGL